MKHRDIVKTWNRLVVEMGTAASGHWGHASVKGKHGGSARGRGGGAHQLAATKFDKEGKRVMLDGSPLPPHIAKLPIPPAWTNVRVNLDPKGALLVKGRDSAGRGQPIYSERFAKAHAAEKYSRAKALERAFGSIRSENERNCRSGNPTLRENAECLKLIMETGIRPGGKGDSKAKVKAYGATTLEGRHVVKASGGTATLEFVGKKGVSLSIPVTNRDTATMVLSRAKKAGPDGPLFNTDSKDLSSYSHSLHSGAGFKTKDFRTRLANEVALAEMRRHTAPTNMKEYKKRVKAVAASVAVKLGNTATVCLQSYINPVVFADWRLAA